MRQIVPGQLIIFAKLDRSNRLTIKTNGIIQWKPNVENFLWNNLGKNEFFMFFTSIHSDYIAESLKCSSERWEMNK